MTLSKDALTHTQTFDDGTLTSETIKGRGLYVSPMSARQGFPADGTTEILFGYSLETGSPPSSIDFDINGSVTTVTVEEHPDHPGYYAAEDTLTASEPGEIEIQAKGQSIIIQAT